MSDKVKFVGEPSRIKEDGDKWILIWPRAGGDIGAHRHTYGQLTPYFKGLKEGRLLATYCTNPGCPIGQGDGDMWLPPRAECPDCSHTMEWKEIPNPVIGEIYTYTWVKRGGTGLEIETPYHQIDVWLPGVGSIFKGYLVDRKDIKIGDKVVARFRTGEDATHTSLDIYWELYEG